MRQGFHEFTMTCITSARTGRWLTTSARGLWQIALPRHCHLCGARAPRWVCRACARAHWRDTQARCPCCALPLASDTGAARCGACLSRAPAFDATIVLQDYAPPLDRFVLDLKFDARLGLAQELGERLARALHRYRRQSDVLIVPVPLAPKRLAERGFNQTWEIARAMARRLGVSADARALRRIRATAPQAGLDVGARRRNLRGAFDVQARVCGKTMIVVDDIMTTGVTLDAAARVLKRHGAATVINAVALRTPKY